VLANGLIGARPYPRCSGNSAPLVVPRPHSSANASRLFALSCLLVATSRQRDDANRGAGLDRCGHGSHECERLFRRSLIVVALASLTRADRMVLGSWLPVWLDLGSWDCPRGCRFFGFDDPRLSDRSNRGRCDRVRFNVRSRRARQKLGSDRRCSHGCRRQRPRGFCSRSRRMRPEIAPMMYQSDASWPVLKIAVI